jgi:hypothetical protein
MLDRTRGTKIAVRFICITYWSMVPKWPPTPILFSVPFFFSVLPAQECRVINLIPAPRFSIQGSHLPIPVPN